MRLGKASSVEELQIVSRFESLRALLLTERYAKHIEKPLAHWALPTDRRLPLAFLGRTLRDLLNTPFDDLKATPGIGQKKVRSFVGLLSRVASTNPTELPAEVVAIASAPRPVSDGDAGLNGFDPASVSEVVWGQWRTSVARHGLGKELLGRFAPSLKNMTRVIWNKPLEYYTHRTLAEIRSMKTHGEKRVRAILEVFHSVHVMVGGLGVQDHLVARIVPRRIDDVENWIGRVLQMPSAPSGGEIRQRFVLPLLEQVRTDATQQITSLAENRLGIHGTIASVRQVARSMGLTRARVYQLLNEINDILQVRWPNGRHQVYELSDKLHADAAERGGLDLSQFDAAVELFYPGSRRGAAGPLEPPAASDLLDSEPAEAETVEPPESADAVEEDESLQLAARS